MTSSWKDVSLASPVCVTGASGFIGANVTKLLLEHGYTVRGTVRDPSNEVKTRRLTALPVASERLSLYQADLLEPHSFDTVFEGCVGVIHTACPIFTALPLEDELAKPAIEGTKNVFCFCNQMQYSTCGRHVIIH